MDDIAEVNEIANLRAIDIGRQIGLNQNRGRVLDADRAGDGEYLANWICIGGSIGGLIPDQIRTNAEGQ